MMPMIRRLDQVLIDSENLRGSVYPTSANGVPVVRLTVISAAVAWTFGLWTPLIAAITTDVQIEAVFLDNFVGAPSDGEVRVAIGAAGSEVEILQFPSVGASWFSMKPIKVPAGSRLSARYRTSTGAADSVDLYIFTLSGF